MVNNIYSIQLNSAKGTLTGISGASGNNSLSYIFDWSVLPDKKAFKFSFIYIGCANTLQGTTIPIVELDIGQTNNYITIQNGCGAQQSKYIGNLYPNSIGGTSYLYSGDNLLSTILPIRPNNTQLIVNIRNQDGGFWLDDAATPIPPAKYILTLNFEEI
jgi:hypothetical protein